MNIFQILLEITIGRLILTLPHDDLEEINRMIKKNLERKKNAEVQEEDNPTDGL